MLVFINDRPLRLTQAKRANLPDPNHPYDVVIDSRLEFLRADQLMGHVLVLNASLATLDRALELLHQTHPGGLQSLTLGVVDKKEAEERLKTHFKIVKAAGGVVFDGEKMLLMYRLKRWDLPKGKLDEGEKSREAALREVEEETGVVAQLGGKICTTWHTYTHNGNRVLKRTKWYRMTCLDHSALEPQWEENIERLEWMTKKEAQNALVDSYSSIRYVFDELWKQEVVSQRE